MEYAGMKESVLNWLAAKLLSRLDEEAVKGALDALIVRLREKAEETETLIDDWTVDALEDAANDEEKVRIITAKVQELIGKALGV